MTSPYRKQKRKHFWKSVAGAAPEALAGGLYAKKFEIDFAANPKIATAGSCFAQNIRRELLARDLNYYDVEPAPEQLSGERRKDFGFDLFSARFGNIYTVAQLEQLLLRAYGRFAPEDDAWEKDGRWFDPFRPTIEPGGFASKAELEASRDSHFRAVRQLFEKADVFIFTLGLTEAWRARTDGAVYPMCPGTAAGSFDADAHEFHNYSVGEVVAAFERVMALVAAKNPGIRFILTVSPVPLVATATPDHVVSATSYSKAVLRAAAGELTGRHDTVDYFPSFEIFTSPLTGGTFFADNRRDPAPEGVAAAMRMFFEAHSVDEIPRPTEEETVHERHRKRAQAFLARQQEICDEMLLEAELND